MLQYHHHSHSHSHPHFHYCRFVFILSYSILVPFCLYSLPPPPNHDVIRGISSCLGHSSVSSFVVFATGPPLFVCHTCVFGNAPPRPAFCAARAGVRHWQLGAPSVAVVWVAPPLRLFHCPAFSDIRWSPLWGLVHDRRCTISTELLVTS